MSEKMKKIAKWLGIILGGVVLLIALLLGGIFYFPENSMFLLRNMKFFMLVLVYTIMTPLLYYKKYKQIWVLLGFLGVVSFVGSVINYSCGFDPFTPFLMPFIVFLPLFMVFYVIRAIKGIITKKKIITKEDNIILLFLCICAVLGWVLHNVTMGACRAGKMAEVYDETVVESANTIENVEMLNTKCSKAQTSSA